MIYGLEYQSWLKTRLQTTTYKAGIHHNHYCLVGEIRRMILFRIIRE